ncbi:ribose phosphate diphosphokinase [Grosmannia clavigera kw1407]|uniref:Ribose-phosphate pyrophosphokinase 1 n=1 Tax=Grosmannia clavigera (strain kw1407 / UAMH 11150) TaxID=655863 RepID=F0XFL4_GROCL|nr:ribose phosphate diphosphokinase [Grosmannia clavigera kw1407]EFX03649.1 ribose phosphate diphosphokinase [Grosmannia clavigera kw1407]
MRNTHIFAGTSCPALTNQICGNLGMAKGEAELTQFSNGETSVRILTSVREKDVFIVQSGSPRTNDTLMELLIMVSACKGGSASKVTAVMPYFPYSRQSKKKSHRGAVTARMIANLLDVAGVKHVITVDLHASQMQGFFQCTVDNLHAEPLIARWIRHNIPEWKESVVVSKNAGGTKRVTSLADALKLNFGMVTTDKRRWNNMTASMILHQSEGGPHTPAAIANFRALPSHTRVLSAGLNGITHSSEASSSRGPAPTSAPRSDAASVASTSESTKTEGPFEEQDGKLQSQENAEYNDRRAREVTHARFIQGRIVPDDFPSPALSATGSVAEDDPMTMSHVSSFFQPESHALGGSGDEGESSSDEEAEASTHPPIERMVTLVGDVRDRTVLIVDDMIDKPTSWIAAAETVVKKGGARKVYCIATHGVFGGDCLKQLQACECITGIIVTNSYPIRENYGHSTSKLVVLDLSFLLAEAIRRNHYGESMSPLFQHVAD